MKRINFSVIIPAYNAATFIINAVESVKRQTYSFFEIIIVDDGSQDNTAKVVENYFSLNNDINVQLLRQENKKNAAARNAGINAASGEWIAFLDADDIWYEGKLERVVDIINNNPLVDLVCHDEKISVNGKIVKENHYGPFNDYLNILLDSCCLSTSAVCVKKEKLREAGGFCENPNFNSAEDFDLWLRLSKVVKFYYHHELLGEYRQTKNSSSSNIDYHTLNYLNVVNHHFKQLPTDVQIQYKKKYTTRVSNILAAGGRRYMQAGHFFKARYWYIKSFQYRIFNYKALIGYFMSIVHFRF